MDLIHIRGKQTKIKFNQHFINIPKYDNKNKYPYCYENKSKPFD